jgi:hypothetical protein
MESVNMHCLHDLRSSRSLEVLSNLLGVLLLLAFEEEIGYAHPVCVGKLIW